MDWAELLRRTFAVEVFACVRCGGRRRVLAYVKGAAGGRVILEHLGLPRNLVRLREAAGIEPAACHSQSAQHNYFQLSLHSFSDVVPMAEILGFQAFSRWWVITGTSRREWR